MTKRKLKEYEVVMEEVFIRYPVVVKARNQKEAKRKAIDKRSDKLLKMFNRMKNPMVQKCSLYKIRAFVDAVVRNQALPYRISSER